MKKIRRNFVALICLVLTLVAVQSAPIAGQAPAKSKSPASKSVAPKLRELALAKQSNRGLTLLSPEDLSAVFTDATKDFFSLDPCMSAAAINFNQTINGVLSSTDCRLDDGSYADFYIFEGTKGQTANISLGTPFFDAYLGLANQSGSFVLENDDAHNNTTDSRISTTLPETGLYVILATSYHPAQTGNYALNLSNTNAPSNCTYSLPTNYADVRGDGTTFSATISTQNGCPWTATSNSSFITTGSSGTGSGTFTMTVTRNETGVQRTGTVTIGGQVFTIMQPAACIYALSSTSLNIGALETSGTFSVTVASNCTWTAYSSDYFVSVTRGYGPGNGTVTFTVQTNNGAARTGKIGVGDQIFTITQAGLNCTYAMSANKITSNKEGRTGVFSFTTQPNCTWRLYSGAIWIELSHYNGVGSAEIRYKIHPASEARLRQTNFSMFGYETQTLAAVEQDGRFFNPASDFDGDGKGDLAVFRSSNSNWYIGRSNADYVAQSYGATTDKIVPADYDGDGMNDIAVFTPETGTWKIKLQAGGEMVVRWGQTGDIPVPADYSGDKKADIAVYRPSEGTWHISRSPNLSPATIKFGAAEDIPVPKDYDGDNFADIAVYRPSEGVWYRYNFIRNTFTSLQFGMSEDHPVPADYDGDSKIDIAVWRPSNGYWYVLNAATNTFSAIQFGMIGDKPLVSDFDGDHKSDFAVFRPSSGHWYLLNSTEGFKALQFGQNGDSPIPNVFPR